MGLDLLSSLSLPSSSSLAPSLFFFHLAGSKDGS